MNRVSKSLIVVALCGGLFAGCGGSSGGGGGAPPPAPSSPTLDQTTPMSRGYNGMTYNVSLIPRGGVAPLAVTSSGTVPTGLVVSAEGTVQGVPTVNGLFTFTATVTDANGQTSSKVFSIRVTDQIVVTSDPTLPAGSAGAVYSHTMPQPTGGIPPYQDWSVDQGTLPPGLTLNSSTGVISGTPTQQGSYSFRVMCRDSGGDPGNTSVSRTPSNALFPSYTLTIN